MSGTYVRATEIDVEVLAESNPYVRSTEISVEVLAESNSPYVRATEIDVEVLAECNSPYVRCTCAVLELLIPNIGVFVPSIFPILTGQDIQVTKRPQWNWGSAEGTSGAEVRVSYWSYPLWEWDIAFPDYLPDFSGAGTTSSDLKALMGFYLSTQCGFLPFLYKDSDDNQVLGQVIGTTDGTTSSFLLVRTYGLPAYGTTTEPVGYVNTLGPVLNGHASFNVYLNGALQSPSSYTVITSVPVSQQLRFNSAPAAGSTITVDMSYYYYARFLDAKYDFNRYMNQLWSIKKMTIHSLRQ